MLGQSRQLAVVELRDALFTKGLRVHQLIRPGTHFDWTKALHHRESQRLAQVWSEPNAHKTTESILIAVDRAQCLKELVSAVRVDPRFYMEVRDSLFNALGITAIHQQLALSVRNASVARYSLDELPETVSHPDDQLLSVACEGAQYLEQFVAMHTQKHSAEQDATRQQLAADAIDFNGRGTDN
jgi:hypothetical protein